MCGQTQRRISALVHSYHLISICINSCNADSSHPRCSLRTDNNSMHGARRCSANDVCLCVCVIHSLQTVLQLAVFLTHLWQNCNLAHWTFKLLDVTSKGIAKEKHHLLLIVTFLTPVKPFASLATRSFYSLLSPDNFFRRASWIFVQFAKAVSVFSLCRCGYALKSQRI